MSSTERFREFVNERMMLAAEEIFGAFKKTFLESEEEIRRQRRLLDVLLNPVVKLARVERPQQRVRAEEEVAESPRIKVELEGSCPGQEGPLLVTKARSEIILLTPAREKNGRGGDEKLWLNPDVKRSDAELQTDICVSMIKSEADQEGYGAPEPKSDAQLPLNSPDVAESATSTRNCKYGDSKPPQDVEGLCAGQEDEESAQEQGDDNLTSACGDAKEETVCRSPDKTSSAGEKESVVNTPVKSSAEQEPKTDHKLPSNEKKRSRERASGSMIAAARKRKREHGKSHSERPFSCKTCGRGFVKEAAFREHLKTHVGEKLCICETCGRGFLEVSKLEKHIRGHSRQRQHICLFCKRGFFARSELERHKLIHTDERPFMCETCGRGFKRTSHLNRHKKTHKT